MSNTIAYSASFVGLLLAIGDPELSNKKMTLTSAVSTDNDDSFALHLSYYPGIEPRAVQDEDIVLASGSLRVVFSNGIMTLFSDATSLNVVVDAEHVSKGVVNPASNTTCVISTTGMCLRTEPGDRGFVMETGAWNTEQSAIQKWSCIWRFPDTRRWANTLPPNVNTPAQVRGHLIGQEDGIPVNEITELTYLPKTGGSTPRRPTASSTAGSPTAGKRLFGGSKRKAPADDDTGDETQKAGPSSPSKRPRGGGDSNTLLQKLQTAALKEHPSLSPPLDVPSDSPPPPKASASASSPQSSPQPNPGANTRSAGKRRAV